MEFHPERYLKDGQLNPDVRDPGSATFGFGRRSVDPTYFPITLLPLAIAYSDLKTLTRNCPTDSIDHSLKPEHEAWPARPRVLLQFHLF